MRWIATATIFFALVGAAYGCSSASDTVFYDSSNGGVGLGRARDSESAGNGAQAGDREAAGEGGADGNSSPHGPSDAGGSGAPDAGDGEPARRGSTALVAGAAAGGALAVGGARGGAASGGVASGGVAGGTAMTLPNAPSGLLLQVVSATTVSLAWTDHSTDEAGFDVYWSTTASKPSTPNLEQPRDSVSAVADVPRCGPDVYVLGAGVQQRGPERRHQRVGTPPRTPAPTGLSVTGGATSATLTWTDAASDESGYRVFYSKTNTQPTVPQKELSANATSYSLPMGEMTPYSTYYFWVVAYNAAGNGLAATGTGVAGVVPTAPTGVVVDAGSKVWYVLATWVDNSASTTSYNVYWSTDDTKPAQAQDTVPAGSTFYRMKQVLGNQTYRFWIETVNAIGKSLSSKAIADQATFDMGFTELYYDDANKVIHHTVQDIFGLVSDTLPGSSALDTSTQIYGYHSTTPGALGSGSLMAPGINWSVTSPAVDTSVLQYFQTEMRTPLGSLFSPVKSLMPPAAISGLASSAVGDLSATVSWSAAANAASYQLYYGTGTFAQASLYTTTSGLTSTLYGLNPGVTYTVWVRGIGAGLAGSGFLGAATPLTVKTNGTYLGPNLALGKTAVASSSTTSAGLVTDGKFDTRWQAATTNANEWIYVNLGDGNATSVTHVELVWEAAYAKTFDIQVCAATCDDVASVAVDSWAWATAYASPTTTLSGFPNYQVIALTTPTVGQFIRLRAKTLATGYGASLYELEAFHAP